MNGLYISNNFFYGAWGTCATGFIFMEAGTFSPSHASNVFYWNNVHIVPSAGSEVNTNAWVGLFDGEGGVTKVFNNTFVGPNSTDNTLCISMQSQVALSYENNVITNCGNPVEISNSTIVVADHNFYGPSCQNGGNCFMSNGSYKGSFSAWQAACGCDASSVQSNSPKLNADGSPQVGAPMLTLGANLWGLATGNLVSMQLDTTDGNTRTPLLRPSTGFWAAGAFSGTAGGTRPAPPASLVGVSH
jgi:hypothetical protein